MADYTTLATVHDRLGIVDTNDDTKLGLYITAASRAVDAWCQRPDNAFVSQSQTRVYDVPSRMMVTTPYTRDVTLTNAQATGYWSSGTVATLDVGWPLGLLTVTSVATDADYDNDFETVWATTDYDLLPINAALDNQPYRTFRVLPTGANQLPVGVRTLQIVGTWGEYAAAPPVIQEATILVVNRWFKRKDTPFGVMGDPAIGMMHIAAVDPDVIGMLDDAGFVKRWRMV